MSDCFVMSLKEGTGRTLHELVALDTPAGSSGLLLSALGPSPHVEITGERSLYILLQASTEKCISCFFF